MIDTFALYTCSRAIAVPFARRSYRISGRQQSEYVVTEMRASSISCFLYRRLPKPFRSLTGRLVSRYLRY